MIRKFFVASLAIVGMSLIGEAQERCHHHRESFSTKHELKVNTLSSILMKSPEFSYEYILNQNISLGGRVGFSFAPKDERDLALQVSPYVRWNFFRDHTRKSSSARGFFTEVNASYNLINTSYYDDTKDQLREGQKSAFGMGIGLGYKYRSSRHWIVEPYIIATRIFSSDIENIYFTPGITIGKQF